MIFKFIFLSEMQHNAQRPKNPISTKRSLSLKSAIRNNTPDTPINWWRKSLRAGLWISSLAVQLHSQPNWRANALRGLRAELQVGVDKQQRLSPATIILYFLIIVCILKHLQCIMKFLLVSPEKQTWRHFVASGSPSSQIMTGCNPSHGWIQLHTFSH